MFTYRKEITPFMQRKKGSILLYQTFALLMVDPRGVEGGRAAYPRGLASEPSRLCMGGLPSAGPRERRRCGASAEHFSTSGGVLGRPRDHHSKRPPQGRPFAMCANTYFDTICVHPLKSAYSTFKMRTVKCTDKLGFV